MFHLLFLSSSNTEGDTFHLNGVTNVDAQLNSASMLQTSAVSSEIEALLHNASDSSHLSSDTDIPCSTDNEAEFDRQKVQNDALDYSANEDDLTHQINITTPSTDVKHLFSYIDQKCHSLFPPWTNSLLFPAHDKHAYDITKYCQPCYKKGGDLQNVRGIIYFSPVVYPTKDGFKGLGFQKLTKDIQRASLASGFELFKNGKYPAKTLGIKCIKFSCCKSRKYICQAKQHTLVTQVRKSTFHQDRQNSRGPDGKKMKRRCLTKKPVSIMHTCKYFFLMYYDSEKVFFCFAWIWKYDSFSPSQIG